MISLGHKATFIAGNQEMKKRLDTIQKLKDFECKILLTTDLTARGIDAQNINLVINLDIPTDGATYLHRIGRSGRYGSRGIAISVVSENEVDSFQDLMGIFGGKDFFLFKLPLSCKCDVWNDDDNVYEKIFAFCKEKPNKNVNENSNGFNEEDKDDHNIKENHIIPGQKSTEDATFKRNKYCCLFDPKLHKTKMNDEDNLEKDSSPKSTHILKILKSVEWQDIKLELTYENSSKWQVVNENVNFRVNIPNFQKTITEEDIRGVMLDLEFEMKTNHKDNDEINCVIKDIENKCDSPNDSSYLIKHDEVNAVLKNIENPNDDLNITFKMFQCLEEYISKHNANNCATETFTGEEIVLNKASEWKDMLQFEIDWLEKLLTEPEYFVIDYGRRKIYSKYYWAMKTFLEIQKKALLCIYPEIQNENEIINTYVYSERNTDYNLLGMFKEIEEFKDSRRKEGCAFNNYFPYPAKIDANYPHLRISEEDINKYKDALNYLQSNPDFVSKYKHLKESLQRVDDACLQILEDELRSKDENMSYDDVLSFVNKWKEENHDLVCIGCKTTSVNVYSNNIKSNYKSPNKEIVNIREDLNNCEPVPNENVSNEIEKINEITKLVTLDETNTFNGTKNSTESIEKGLIIDDNILIENPKTKIPENSFKKKKQWRKYQAIPQKNNNVDEIKFNNNTSQASYAYDYSKTEEEVYSWIPVDANDAYDHSSYNSRGNYIQDKSYSNKSNYFYYSTRTYCNDYNTGNSETNIEEYFQNLRLQTDQLHMQMYYNEMMNFK